MKEHYTACRVKINQKVGMISENVSFVKVEWLAYEKLASSNGVTTHGWKWTKSNGKACQFGNLQSLKSALKSVVNDRIADSKREGWTVHAMHTKHMMEF